MTWMGPTYGMWAGTVAEMDEIVKRSNDKNKVIEQWRDYAKKLEKALDEVSDMYRGKAGEAEGHAELKEIALKEIERLDPTNKLLDPAYRKSIYTQIKEKTVETLKK